MAGLHVLWPQGIGCKSSRFAGIGGRAALDVTPKIPCAFIMSHLWNGDGQVAMTQGEVSKLLVWKQDQELTWGK